MRKFGFILLFLVGILNAKIIGYGNLESYGLSYKDGYAVDKAGKTVAQAKSYDYISEFLDGLAVVEIDEKKGLIDRDGKVIVEPKFTFISHFSQGIASFLENNKYGYIDTNGSIIAEAKFDDAHGFSENLALVSLSGKFGFLDKSGKFAIEPIYELASSFYNGSSVVQVDVNMEL